MIGRPASDETPPQLCLCVPLPTRLSVVRDQQPATDAADASGAMAKDAADAPSEVRDGNASSAESGKVSADPDCPFLRVGGKIDWRSLERAEAEAQRRARAVARLGGGSHYAEQKPSTCTRRRNRRGHCDARTSPVRVTGALMAKHGQSKEDAAARCSPRWSADGGGRQSRKADRSGKSATAQSHDRPCHRRAA